MKLGDVSIATLRKWLNLGAPKDYFGLVSIGRNIYIVDDRTTPGTFVDVEELWRIEGAEVSIRTANGYDVKIMINTSGPDNISVNGDEMLCRPNGVLWVIIDRLGKNNLVFQRTFVPHRLIPPVNKLPFPKMRCHLRKIPWRMELRYSPTEDKFLQCSECLGYEVANQIIRELLLEDEVLVKEEVLDIALKYLTNEDSDLAMRIKQKRKDAMV